MTLVGSSLSFSALGTTASLVTDPPQALGCAREVLGAELTEIDAACSRFRSDSELVGLNASGGAWFQVSSTLLAAVTVALEAARKTAGSVDPTVGASLRSLGYDRDFSQVASVGPPLRVKVARVPGWQRVEVSSEGSAVRLPKGIELDLGATAKALAADRAARRAAESTGAGVLVALGGDLSTAGPVPRGGWPVRVTDDHAAPLDAPGQTVSLGEGGLATSSSTVRSWRRGEVTLHHIVDPVTGRPADSPWRTVSVAAATCVDANTAATAALVRGGGAPAWLEGIGLPSRLVSTAGRVLVVAGWPWDCTD